MFILGVYSSVVSHDWSQTDEESRSEWHLHLQDRQTGDETDNKYNWSSLDTEWLCLIMNGLQYK